MLEIVKIDGKARGIICRNLINGELERHFVMRCCFAAVVMATFLSFYQCNGMQYNGHMEIA